ncbi:MAG: zinc-ribbon domain-containing protein [Acidobacteriota bacterium]|nr:zinc-ribbon domain-containing protein [Acidobacteriota bacterium]
MTSTVKSEFQDRILPCADCGEEFTWSAKDQAFFGERGFEPPKRCPACRQANRQRRAKAGAEKGDGR